MGIFDLPSKSERMKVTGLTRIFCGFFEQGDQKADTFILALLLKTYFILSLVMFIVVYVAMVVAVESEQYSFLYSPQKITNKFEFFKYYIDIIAPISVLILPYYYSLFIKNVELKNFSFFAFNQADHSIGFIASLVIMPLTTLALIFPSENLFGLYRRSAFSWAEQYFDSFFFVFFAGFIWVVFYSMAALLLFSSTIMFTAGAKEYIRKRAEKDK